MLLEAVVNERRFVLGEEEHVTRTKVPKDYESLSLVYDWSTYEEPPQPYSEEV